jgi:hypothetical protein
MRKWIRVVTAVLAVVVSLTEVIHAVKDLSKDHE